MTDTASTGRRPWVAALLSFLCTGLGHVYAGRVARGLTLFFVSLLVMPFVAVLALLEPSGLVLILILASLLFLLLLYLFAAVDAWRVSRPHRVAYRLRDCNRVSVYLLFAIVGLVYPALSAVAVRANFLEAFRVATDSMNPTLRKADRFLVRKADAGYAAARRGQVVVFRKPGDPDVMFVKRIIALPGDRIAVRDGVPYLSGNALPHTGDGMDRREHLESHAYRVCLGQGPEFAEQEVPAGHVFLLGDCRPNSLDSRGFGFVPMGDIVGTAAYVFWPFGDAERFGVVP